MWCSASSTTMPGAIGTRYVAGCPPLRSPRNTSKVASAIAPPLISVVAPVPCRLSREPALSLPKGRLALGPAALQNLFLFRDKLLQVTGHFGHRCLAQRHYSSLADDYIIVRSPGCVQAGMINAAVSSPA